MEWVKQLGNFEQNLSGLLWPELLVYFLIGIVSILVLRSMVALLRLLKTKAKVDATIRLSTCANCRWQGELSGIRKVCPRCGQSNFMDP